jgi:uncharacterized protein (TIGR02246 family)
MWRLEGFMTTDYEAEIRNLLERWQAAFRAKDIDGVMAVYVPGAELTAFDVVPPLQTSGVTSYRKNYEEYDGPIDVELRNLRIIAGSDTAFLHCLDRMSGTLHGGQRSDLWLRVTCGLRKIDGQWRIVHDHISVPANFESGAAVFDLQP